MSKIAHGSFTIERVFTAPVARAFAAYTVAEARYRWLMTSDGRMVRGYRLAATARTGAVEFFAVSLPGSDAAVMTDTTFLDVEVDRRVILASATTIDGAPLSSSLLTAEFVPEGTNTTRLVLTEQGAYHDGNIGGRKHGMIGLLDKLGQEIERSAGA